MKQTLWTFDFTVITIGTIISAIGGVAMNFAFSLVVYDQTQSTFLTGIFAAVSFLPSVVIPMLVAPLVDQSNRKHVIVRFDLLSGILYLLFSLFLSLQKFSLLPYMLFSVVMGVISSIYNLAYQSLYPELIPKGFAQKGYSISSLIYPSVTALITPIASLLYVQYGIVFICLIEGILLLCASGFECGIKYQEQRMISSENSWKSYKTLMREGFQYMKQEKGIRSIYMYMSLTSGSGEGMNLMSMAYFQSNPSLGTTRYALLTTAEMLGRFLGSIVHYFFTIPNQKRYTFAARIYTMYEGLDMMLLFLAYPLMVANRFMAGFLGINSLNIREASTQNYIPSHMRARVNAFFSMIIAICSISAKLIAGVLGELLAYKYVGLLFATSAMLGVIFIILRNKKYIQPIYNQKI